MKIRNTQKITNEHLLNYNTNDWFPIRRDGQLENREEFIHYKMTQLSLRTPLLVIRALHSAGIE